jgi:hypothetical protein
VVLAAVAWTPGGGGDGDKYRWRREMSGEQSGAALGLESRGEAAWGRYVGKRGGAVRAGSCGFGYFHVHTLVG